MLMRISVQNPILPTHSDFASGIFSVGCGIHDETVGQKHVAWDHI